MSEALQRICAARDRIIQAAAAGAVIPMQELDAAANGSASVSEALTTALRARGYRLDLYRDAFLQTEPAEPNVETETPFPQFFVVRKGPAPK